MKSFFLLPFTIYYGLQAAWFLHGAIRQKLYRQSKSFIFVLAATILILGESFAYSVGFNHRFLEIINLEIPLIVLGLAIHFSTREQKKNAALKSRISVKLPLLGLILGHTIIEHAPIQFNSYLIMLMGIIAMILSLVLLWGLLDRFRLIYRNLFFASLFFTLFQVFTIIFETQLGPWFILKCIMALFLYQAFNIILVNDYLRRTLRHED